MKNQKAIRNFFIPKSLLFQYIISYIIVLAIPLIFFSAFIQYRFRAALISEIQESSQLSLSNYVIREEKNMEKIQSIVNSITIQSEFHPFESPSEYEKASDLMNALEDYAAGGEFPLIGVYWSDSDYLYSNIGTCRMEALPADVVGIQAKDPAGLHVFLSGLSPLTSQKDAYVMYSMPISSGTYGTKRYIIFAQTIQQFLESISYPVNSTDKLYIYTDREYFIYGNAEELATLVSPEDWEANQETLSSFFSLDGKSLVHQLYSAPTGLTFLNTTPLTDALATANRLQTETILCIIAILLLSGFLITLMIHFNYSPIQQLLQSVEHLFKPQHQKGNEIQAIQQAFRNLESQKNQIMNDTRKASQDYYIRSLFKRGTESVKDGIESSDFQPVFTYSRFSVCSLLIEQHSIPAEKLCAEIQALFAPYCLCYPVEENQQHSFAAIINFDGRDDEYYDALNSIRNLAEKKLHCPVTLACGSICEDVGNLPQIYMESIYTLDYNYIKGKNCVILYEEVRLQDEFDTSYPYVELRNLKNQLKQRNIKAINLQLDSILDYINTCGVPLFVARRISYDIVNMVLSSLKDEELKNNQSYINSLTRFRSVQELADAVYNIYHNLIVIPEDGVSSTPDTISDMKSYVQENFTCSDFSLQNMAEYFGMSMTGLSQYFKNKSGQTLIDYYSALRIELAKKLLSEHKYKIEEIAAMTGYNNTSSFIRRFKQLTGMSPGQYSTKSLI